MVCPARARIEFGAQGFDGPVRRFNSVLLALLAHGVAVVVLGVVAGQHGTRITRSPRVTVSEHPEHLRFVAPAVHAPVPRTLVQSNPQARRPLTPNPPRETSAPARDTGAAIATSPPAVAPAARVLASPLPGDQRLIVGPAAASGVADMRVRAANASIVSRLRAIDDSAKRKALGWTVGDSTHRFGLAECGIAISKICIPFGFSSMPNRAPVPAFSAVDRNRDDDATVGAAIDRVRASQSKPSDSLPRH